MCSEYEVQLRQLSDLIYIKLIANSNNSCWSLFLMLSFSFARIALCVCVCCGRSCTENDEWLWWGAITCLCYWSCKSVCIDYNRPPLDYSAWFISLSDIVVFAIFWGDSISFLFFRLQPLPTQRLMSFCVDVSSKAIKICLHESWCGGIVLTIINYLPIGQTQLQIANGAHCTHRILCKPVS